jgi:hypothetical protein
MHHEKWQFSDRDDKSQIAPRALFQCQIALSTSASNPNLEHFLRLVTSSAKFCPPRRISARLRLATSASIENFRSLSPGVNFKSEIARQALFQWGSALVASASKACWGCPPPLGPDQSISGALPPRQPAQSLGRSVPRCDSALRGQPKEGKKRESFGPEFCRAMRVHEVDFVVWRWAANQKGESLRKTVEYLCNRIA